MRCLGLHPIGCPRVIGTRRERSCTVVSSSACHRDPIIRGREFWNRLNKVNSIIETNPIGPSDYLRIWRKIITNDYE